VLWNPGYHVHLLLGPRGGPLTEDKEHLFERKEVRDGYDTLPRGTSRSIQDLAISRLPQGLMELPSTRGISRDAIRMPSRASGVGVTLPEDDASHDAYRRGVKVQVCLHKVSWLLPPFPKGVRWTVQVQQGVSTPTTTTPMSQAGQCNHGLSSSLGRSMVTPRRTFLGEEVQGLYKRKGRCPIV
jgi:hypothetical protein